MRLEFDDVTYELVGDTLIPDYKRYTVNCTVLARSEYSDTYWSVPGESLVADIKNAWPRSEVRLVGEGVDHYCNCEHCGFDPIDGDPTVVECTFYNVLAAGGNDVRKSVEAILRLIHTLKDNGAALDRLAGM